MSYGEGGMSYGLKVIVIQVMWDSINWGAPMRAQDQDPTNAREDPWAMWAMGSYDFFIPAINHLEKIF